MVEGDHVALVGPRAVDGLGLYEGLVPRLWNVVAVDCVKSFCVLCRGNLGWRSDDHQSVLADREIASVEPDETGLFLNVELTCLLLI